MYRAQGKVPFPDKYDLVADGSGMVGLNYIGQRGVESVIPIVCTDIACWVCMGKITIVYSSPIYSQVSPYMIRNRKGDKSITVPVYDFFGGTNFLYILTNAPQGGVEWAKLNPDYTIEKFVGPFTLNDYAVKNGVRVLVGSSKTGLDVLDRHEKTARVIFKTGEVEEVITFSKSSKASLIRQTHVELPKPKKFSLEINLTTEDVYVYYDNSEVLRLGNLPGVASITELLDCITKEWGTLKISFSKKVTVGRTNKEHSYLKYGHIEVEKGRRLIEIFQSLEIYGKGAFFLILLRNMNKSLTGNELLTEIHKGVCGGYRKINDKYSFKIVFCYDLAILAVKQLKTGRVHTELLDWTDIDAKKFNGLDEQARTLYGYTGDNIEIFNMSVKPLEESDIKKVGRIPKSLSAVGSAKRGHVSINNPKYTNGYEVAIGFKDSANPSVAMLLAFCIFDGFSYDNYSPKEVQNGIALGKAIIHDKKYSDKNFVLSTKTDGFTVCVNGGASGRQE